MDATARPQKRMRLGTKSCWECRRRKVRCIFPPKTKVCKKCTLHDAECTSQTPQQSLHMTGEPSEDVTAMRQRLEQLEGMVRTLCKAVGQDQEYLSSGSVAKNPNSMLIDTKSPESGSFIDNADLAADSTTAPLLKFLKTAMLVEENEIHESAGRVNLTAQRRTQTYLRYLRSLIPTSENLTAILEATARYWPLWNAFPEDIKIGSEKTRLGVAEVQTFILDSIDSDNGFTVARAILCLALCIQQLPSSFKNESSKSGSTLGSLVDTFMAGTETLISTSEGNSGSLERLECYGLQARLYIDMGKPRSAWLCLRNAMSHAILEGLHLLDESADQRQRNVWSHVWQYDRHLSLVLGFPSSIAISHPGVSRSPCDQSAGEQAMFGLAVLVGQIIERNQRHEVDGFYLTQEIEKQLDQYENGPASTLLRVIPTSAMSLQEIYGIQTLKILYHNACKALHFPYMLKSTTDPEYEHNRISALASAREVIKAWQGLRDCCGSDTLVICDLMDFQVFTGALVLVINLLSASCPDDSDRQTRDWALIDDTSHSLRSVSEALECHVAGQASELLDYLSAAYHGAFNQEEPYEATIPYFGKVRISQVKKRRSARQEDALPLELYDDGNIFSNLADFSVDTFAPFSQNYMGDYLTEAELGVDWTTIFDTGRNYDWSQCFDTSALAPN